MRGSPRGIPTFLLRRIRGSSSASTSGWSRDQAQRGRASGPSSFRDSDDDLAVLAPGVEPRESRLEVLEGEDRVDLRLEPTCAELGELFAIGLDDEVVDARRLLGDADLARG